MRHAKKRKNPAKSVPGIRDADGADVLGRGILGQLQWSGLFEPDWEVLVYKRRACWEACLLEWSTDRHEHVTGVSLIDAQHKAQQCIRQIGKVRSAQTYINNHLVPGSDHAARGWLRATGFEGSHDLSTASGRAGKLAEDLCKEDRVNAL